MNDYWWTLLAIAAAFVGIALLTYLLQCTGVVRPPRGSWADRSANLAWWHEALHSAGTRTGEMLGRPKPPVVSPQVLARLQSFSIPPEESEECSVCQEPEHTQGVIRLPCGHRFHASCIRQWLSSHPTCPTCRMQIFQGEDLIQAPTLPDEPSHRLSRSQLRQEIGLL